MIQIYLKAKRVDLASLYATLNEVKDERLEQALKIVYEANHGTWIKQI